MEKIIIGGIVIAMIIILIILVLKTREHYNEYLPIWHWTALDKKNQPADKCIMKPGKYFTPGM